MLVALTVARIAALFRGRPADSAVAITEATGKTRTERTSGQLRSAAGSELAYCTSESSCASNRELLAEHRRSPNPACSCRHPGRSSRPGSYVATLVQELQRTPRYLGISAAPSAGPAKASPTGAHLHIRASDHLPASTYLGRALIRPSHRWPIPRHPVCATNTPMAAPPPLSAARLRLPQMPAPPTASPGSCADFPSTWPLSVAPAGSALFARGAPLCQSISLMHGR